MSRSQGPQEPRRAPVGLPSPRGAEGALPRGPEGVPGSPQGRRRRPSQGPRRGPWVPRGAEGAPGLGFPWAPLGPLGAGPLGPWGHPKIIYLVGALRAPGRRQTRSSNKSRFPCSARAKQGLWAGGVRRSRLSIKSASPPAVVRWACQMAVV